MEITYLADNPEFVDLLARWQHQQWSHISPERTLADRVQEFKDSMNQNEIPLTVIAKEGDRVLGSATLARDEMENHTDWNPWVANIYVAEGERRRGIAHRLVGRIIEEAEALGFANLYLFGYSDAAIYEDLGFEEISRETYRGHQAVIMRRPLAADARPGPRMR